ncbi:hypothetical protein C1H46_042055 [Malus baccata]|uniref:non-specific serine/threonine protein kinase n=1 Tax=Malus baccata TaxID=106549 RepID=A0A540KDW0_MALBA|nr:hypothetical protein C1H46_042055 [Malus baccata]
MAVALVGGAAIGALFGVLYDVVKESMGRTVMQYKPLLEDLKFTLDCLRPRIIQEIGNHNVELGLPNDDIVLVFKCEGKNHVQFSWQTRREICIGVACGLAFLHERTSPPNIHRGIKASNILLDKDLVPKISDFCLAKLYPASTTHARTHVAGAIGYIAPEYAIRGQLTRKADVYSFGVLLLEIVSGRCNTNPQLDGQYLLERTWQLYEQRALVGLVDTSMRDDCDTEEACRFLQIGLICTHDTPKLRPHMTTVIKMLTGEVDVNDCKISKPSLISDFMDLEVRDPASSVSIHSSAPMSSLQSSSKTSH